MLWVDFYLANEIVHSTYQKYECTQVDIDFVCEFYDRLINQRDPLALIGKRHNQYNDYFQSGYTESNSRTYHRQYRVEPAGCATFMLLVCLTVIFGILIL